MTKGEKSKSAGFPGTLCIPPPMVYSKKCVFDMKRTGSGRLGSHPFFIHTIWISYHQKNKKKTRVFYRQRGMVTKRVGTGYFGGVGAPYPHSAPLDLRREKKIVQAYATCQTSFRSPVNILVIIYKSHADQNPTFTT